MKKENARKFRYTLVVIAAILLIYDVAVQSWWGVLATSLLILSLVLSDINELKEKRSKET